MKIELFTCCTENEVEDLETTFKYLGDAVNLPLFNSREEEIQDRDTEVMEREGVDAASLKHIKITIEVEDKNEETANVA